MRPLPLIGTIIAAITLVLDLVFMFVLVTVGEAAGALQDPSLGADAQQVGQAFSLVLAMGWVWAVLILATCAFAIYQTWFVGRPGKKK